MRKFLVMPVLLGGLVLATAGCEVSRTVSAEKVEEQLDAKFGPPFEDAGIGPATSECPESLTGEVGATIECTVHDSTGRAYSMVVTVTSVEGDQVNFSMKEAG